MVKRPLSNRIQKTTILFVIALAALGAVGVTTMMIATATTADAQPLCFFNGQGRLICPGPPDFCIISGQGRLICPGPP